ncbi:hypothetical protein A4H97_06925 [Niastella yeongjuensis]|uniref:Uncharacterized protein n=1 Tax=Niastella yeongjuensis TaxID=354355 RepID=A0A1V9EM61_9BACT|nr:hypothetical protein A4H97_06925 [Niastella yeongjuensis]
MKTGQKAEGRGQKAEGRRQRAEGRGQKEESRDAAGVSRERVRDYIGLLKAREPTHHSPFTTHLSTCQLCQPINQSY